MAKKPTKPSVNATLLNATIRRTVFVQRVKTQFAQEVVAMLNQDVLPDIVSTLETRLMLITKRGFDTNTTQTARLRSLMKTIREQLGETMTPVEQGLVGNLEELAQAEAAWQVKALKGVTNMVIDFNAPSIETLNALIESRPFEGQLLTDWFNSLENGIANRAEKALNIGMTRGESIPDMVKRFVGTRDAQYQDGFFNGSRREAEAIVRTAVNHVSNHAREATFEENSDVIDKVQLVATLDTRTTLQCMAHDGETYPVNEGPRPPFHFGCRTTVVPVLKSWKELGIEGLKEMPESTRASMDGQVAKSTTYGEWLADQPAAVQDEALGPSRAELFRNGMTIDKFVDRKDSPLTLKQLSALEDKLAK